MKIIRHARLLSTLNRIHTYCLDALQVRRLDALLRGRALRPSSLRAELSTPLRGEYLISTERGIFRAAGSRVENIFPLCTFGLSIEGDRFYTAVSIGEWSYIVGAQIDFTGDGTFKLTSFRLLQSTEARYSNERVHQVHARGGKVAAAKTRSNSLLLIDAESGRAILDVYPLSDATGFPIHTDHNHINSVYQAGDVIFFVAHNAGKLGSFLGFVHGNRVVAAEFPHRGVHDIVPTARGLIFSDTFGASLQDFRGGGNLLIGGSPVLPTTQEKGFVVRGVAGTADEMVVGHSNLSKRADRFKANGALLVLRGKELKSVNPMPFSQAYDIIRIDGRKFDDEVETMDAAAARAMITRDVGPIVYDAPYHMLKDGEREYQPGRLAMSGGT